MEKRSPLPNATMNTTESSIFPDDLLHLYGAAMEEALFSPPPTFDELPLHPLLYHLSTIKHKLLQVESILSLPISPPSVVDAAALVQDVILAASSMVLLLHQQSNPAPVSDDMKPNFHEQVPQPPPVQKETAEELKQQSPAPCDVIEVNAADLLAKYTHFCRICGKGFKRDANLRMHMRAHGDEYKTTAALVNPSKKGSGEAAVVAAAAELKYSCPQEGCKWNRKHSKFQPLKSMVCVKNHYRRSHCPKLYACRRCDRRQFSVLSDLRTHEKHCGKLKWACSCGTTFSRKDKLMGHVALFVGHEPVAADGRSTNVRC